MQEQSGERFPGVWACVALAMIAGGCVSSKSGRGVALRPDDFAGDETVELALTPRGEVVAAAPAVNSSEVSEGLMELIAQAGEPVLSEKEPGPAAPSVLVDGTAGYVNNKAVYMNDFLAPMADRLRAEAQTLPRAQWVDSTRVQIRQRLNLMIEDELLRAEAMAQLGSTEEKRHGLAAYFDSKRGDIVRRFGGTETGANEALQQRDDESVTEFGSDIQGKSVDDVLATIKKRELIGYQLQSRVGSRAYIPWRDVLMAYEREYARFNPPPTVLLRLISVPASKADVIERVRISLEAGEDFAKLAAEGWNEYSRQTGGLFTRELKGDFETSQIINVPALDAAAHKLKPGEVAGPIPYGRDVYWVKLEEIRSRAMGLYEAQLALEGELRQDKFKAERARYINRLKERASYTDLNEMTERLLAAAIERFNPEPPAPAPAPAPAARDRP